MEFINPNKPVPGPFGRKDGKWSVGNVHRNKEDGLEHFRFMPDPEAIGGMTAIPVPTEKVWGPWIQGITAPSGKHYVLVRISDGSVTVYSHGIGCYFRTNGEVDYTRGSLETFPAEGDLPEYIAVFEHHTLPYSTRGSEG